MGTIVWGPRLVGGGNLHTINELVGQTLEGGSIECFWDDVGGGICIYHLPFSTSVLVFGLVRMVHLFI